jgi:hypothetical protein
MKWARSIGISDRRAIHAASLAEASYSARGNPAGSYVSPTCSIPTDSWLILAFPACQAMSDWWTSCLMRPSRSTT